MVSHPTPDSGMGLISLATSCRVRSVGFKSLPDVSLLLVFPRSLFPPGFFLRDIPPS